VAEKTLGNLMSKIPDSDKVRTVNYEKVNRFVYIFVFEHFSFYITHWQFALIIDCKEYSLIGEGYLALIGRNVVKKLNKQQ
jgi:hypothetical protein